MNRNLSTLVFPLSAFLLLWLVPWLQLGPWTGTILEPNLFRYGPNESTVSNFSYFLRALGIGLVAIALAEPFKWFRRVTSRLSGLAAFFQASLLFDAVRVNALDWFAYCLHYFGIAEIRVDYGVRPVLPIALPFPWVSLGLLIALAFTTLRLPPDEIAVPSVGASSPDRRSSIALATATAGLALGAALLAALNAWSARASPDEVFGRRAGILLVTALGLAWLAVGFVVRSKRLGRRGGQP